MVMKMTECAKTIVSVIWPNHLWYFTACSKGTSSTRMIGDDLETGINKSAIENARVRPNIMAACASLRFHLHEFEQNNTTLRVATK
jgi:hypothetical protein